MYNVHVPFSIATLVLNGELEQAGFSIVDHPLGSRRIFPKTVHSILLDDILTSLYWPDRLPQLEDLQYWCVYVNTVMCMVHCCACDT